jgi:hypothetical protein
MMLRPQEPARMQESAIVDMGPRFSMFDDPFFLLGLGVLLAVVLVVALGREAPSTQRSKRIAEAGRRSAARFARTRHP